MPNVNVLKKELFAAVGKEFTDEQFEDLCFQYGVELEIGTADEMQMTRNDHDNQSIDISKEIVYKIEVAANRYDLLCLEGISEALRAYLGIAKAPRYIVKNHIPQIHKIIVKPETAQVRPWVVGCVLRNIKFDVKNYNSFIDLQDKLHNNICRKRTLASMGTHDLDKFASDAPITYEALPPSEIVFKALKQKDEMNCVQLFEVFKNDMKMKKFLPILEPHERYPVFYDKNRQVLSLPPIINSDATKITLDTKNVFIEITGTDLVKTKVCLAILASQFSQYCAADSQHTIEQVQIEYEGAPEKNEVTPSLTYNNFTLELAYINRLLGLDIDTTKAAECATKMGLTVLEQDDQKLKIEFAPTRSDILHPCDIIEDVGIGYGYNNIARVFPETNTVGAFQPNNKFADLLRQELAQAGYIEQLTFSLVSYKDNYENMRAPIDYGECVQISNPKTLEFQIVRTSLLPGLLKCLQGNKKEPIPQKIFELQDCVKLDSSHECGARNVRKISAMVCDQSANFEVIHGLLDLIMCKVGSKMQKDYKLVEDPQDPRFFTNRGVSIMMHGKKIGSIGVLHPEVIGNFELKYPCSCLEIEFDPLFDHFKGTK